MRVGATTTVAALLFTGCNPGFIAGIAGSGLAGNTGDGGPATAASFERPGGLLTYPDGSYDVVDQQACVIRHVDPAGTITTIAGTGSCGFSGDGGPATGAQINPGDSTFPAPSGQLSSDAAGNRYLADSGNARIRRIAVDGTITTVAGDGSGSSFAAFSTCNDASAFAGSLAVAPDGTIYVDCPLGVGKLLGNGTLQQVYSGETVAIAVDSSGNLFISTSDGVIHRRTPAGLVSTYVDVNALYPDTITGKHIEITNLAIGPDDTLYGGLGPMQTISVSGWVPTFTDHNSNLVMRFGPDSATIIAGSGDPDPGAGTQHGYGTQLDLTPYGVAVTGAGSLLVSSGHNVYRINDPDQAQPWNGTPCDPALMNPGTDLSGVNLSGVNLYRCDLSDYDLSGANLSGANLTQAVLDGADFTGADLTGADLTGAHGTGIVGTPSHLPPGWLIVDHLLLGPDVDLSGLDLSGLDLSGVDLHGKDLSRTLLVGTNLSGANLSDANLDGAFVSNTNFTGADLSGSHCVFRPTYATSANFTDADVSNVTFVETYNGSSFSTVIFTGANLDGTDLSQLEVTESITSGGVTGAPVLPDTRWKLRNGYILGERANLTGADLHGLDLHGFSLADANLTNATLTNANLTGASIQGATTTGADFTGASVTGLHTGDLVGAPAVPPPGLTYRGNLVHGALVGPGAELSGSDLSDLDLSSLDLTGADLEGSTLVRTNFTGSNLTNLNLGGAPIRYSGSIWVDVNVQGADLSSLQAYIRSDYPCPADLVHSGNIVGTPAHKPNSGILLTHGMLVGSYTSLTGIDFRTWGPDLGLVSFMCSDLSGSNLSGLNLLNRSLNKAVLVGTDLSGANLSGANLFGAQLAGTDLSGATLTGAFGGTVSGSPAALPTGWTASDGLLTGPTVALNYLDLANRDLSGRDLSGATMLNTDFSGASFTNANLTGASLSGTNLTTDLTGATFANANLTGASLSGTTITDTDFGLATLTDIKARDLIGTPLALPTGWTVTNSILVGPTADLTSVNLSFANLSNRDLSGVDFTNAHLSYTNLSGTNLQGTDFTGADLNRLNAGHIIGTPVNLPTGWVQRGTYLLGPTGNFTSYDLSGLDLSGLDLTGAKLTATKLGSSNLTNTSFATATGTPTGGSSAVYANTTCPDATVATAPATCVGHGFGT